VTRALKAWGEEGAEERIWPLVYDELQRMASLRLLRERPDHTLQPSALVHEAYLKLVDQRQARFADRQHFFAIAARVMRRILVDHERSRRYAKRGGGGPRVPIEDAAGAIQLPPPELEAIDEALAALERLEPLKARIVELRFFVGLSHKEIAEVLECSEKTVQRHWRLARTWLYRELRQEDPEDAGA
jgi:RNA polymerase sigma factor (TIGR02999 family)